MGVVSRACHRLRTSLRIQARFFSRYVITPHEALASSWRAPDQHLEKGWGEVEAFFGKTIVHRTAVLRIFLGGEDTVGLKIF